VAGPREEEEDTKKTKMGTHERPPKSPRGNARHVQEKKKKKRGGVWGVFRKVARWVPVGKEGGGKARWQKDPERKAAPIKEGAGDTLSMQRAAQNRREQGWPFWERTYTDIKNKINEKDKGREGSIRTSDNMACHLK